MIQRFVHYVNSDQPDRQPVMLGVSTVNPVSDNPNDKAVVGHSFRMDTLSKLQQEAISLGVTYLLMNPDDVLIVLDKVETRRAA